MTSAKYPPTRTLRDRPDLAELERQAMELLKAFSAGETVAATEVTAHSRGARVDTFALDDARLVIARSYGFASWLKLKAYVDGVTVGRLAETVRAGDLEAVRSMVGLRPELVNLDVAEDDEHRALHHAVLARQPEIVRFLMQRGADPRKGIWPHRDATSPLTIALERGYSDIVAIIQDEARRRPHTTAARDAPVPADLSDAVQDGDHDATLVRHDAERTVRRAIATGNAAWLRARFRDGAPAGHRGLVTCAVKSDRADMVLLLLELGLDPDERERVEGLEEVVYSWGEPLRQCAISSRPALAEILLTHGASANTNVYAASSAMYEAYARQDRVMVALLERHGGFVDAGTAGYLGLADRVRQLFDDEATERLTEGVVPPGGSVAEELLFSAAATGNVELVQMALEHLEWPRGDGRWQWRLMQPFGRHPAADRQRYLTCFRTILQRSGVDLPYRFGRTLLHDVAGAWPRTAPMGEEERTGFASILLDAGARLDVRDDLLKSTPLGWACRWGRVDLVTLLLTRGADPVEVDAEPWATPRAWAEKMRHRRVLSVLQKHGSLS